MLRNFAVIDNLRIEIRKESKGFLGLGVGDKSRKTQDLQSWINNNKDLFDAKGLSTELFDYNGWLNKELANEIAER